MEPNEKNTGKETGQKQENQSGQNQGFDFSKFSADDFKKIFDKVETPELIKHLLTMTGAVGINYLFMIKPMQDKMEEMRGKISEQDGKIKELETKLERLKQPFEKEDEKNEYFTYNKASGSESNGKIRRIVL